MNMCTAHYSQQAAGPSMDLFAVKHSGEMHGNTGMHKCSHQSASVASVLRKGRQHCSSMTAEEEDDPTTDKMLTAQPSIAQLSSHA